MAITLDGTNGITSSGDLTLNNGNADGAQVTLASSGYSNWNLDNYSGRFRAYYNATEYFTITNAGNVGIGTSNPGSKLQVTTPLSTALTLETIQSSSDNCQILFYGTSGARWAIGNKIADGGTGLAFDFYDLSANANRMRIDSSGNVGISTNAPGTTLQISGQTNTPSGLSNRSAYFAVSNASNNDAGVVLGSINGNAPYVAASKLGNGTATPLVYLTNDTERMRIAADGKVTFANVYATTVGATNRDLFIDNTGLIGYVSSVRESKLNIEDLSELSWLYNLNPVSFNYRKKDENGNYTDEIDGDIQYGLIAEDVELIRKDLCFYDESEDGQILRGIQYSKLVVPMLKAIQEQQELIKTLISRIEVLESK